MSPPLVRKPPPLARKSDNQLVVGYTQSETQSPSAASSGSACIVVPVGSGHIALEEVVAAALAGWCSFGCS